MREFLRASTAGLDLGPGDPVWCYYEVDRDADAIVRGVDVFADGRITRDSIALERRNGGDCPSLADQPLAVALAEAPLEPIARDLFEQLWAEGEDRPFWFPFTPAERA